MRAGDNRVRVMQAAAFHALPISEALYRLEEQPSSSSLGSLLRQMLHPSPSLRHTAAAAFQSSSLQKAPIQAVCCLLRLLH